MSGFRNFWQHLPENIDPVLFEIGWFKLQYYGLMYVVAFGLTYFLVMYRLKREDRFKVSTHQAKDLLLNMLLGLIIGARLGYVLFYQFSYYIGNPLEIFLPFSFGNGINFTGISGMSYHGGLIGVLFAAWLFIRKNRLSYREMSDLIAPVAPLGYTFGRLGNFINGELFGRATSSSIGMYFPLSTEKVLRHPSQLYEAFFEGIFLFVVLWIIRKKKLPKGSLLGLYLMGYGLVRFFIEFFREPDLHLGFVFSFFSMGQVLCAVMILCGALLYWILWKRELTFS